MRKMHYHKQEENYKLQLQRPDTVGIIVKATDLYVAIPIDGATNTRVERVESFTPNLEKMANELAEQGVRNIAVSIAGPYWMQVFDLLESRGFAVSLVHPEQIRYREFQHFLHGEDCQRLQQLHSYGLTKSSFVREKQVRTLQIYISERERCKKEKKNYLNNIRVALLAMKLKFPHTVRDLEGVVSMLIIEKISEGEKNVDKLVAIKDTVSHAHQMKATQQQLKDSLTGDYTEEQVFIIKRNLAMYNACKSNMEGLDHKIVQVLKGLKIKLAPGATAKPKSDRKPAETSAQLLTDHNRVSKKKRKTSVRKNQYTLDLMPIIKEKVGVDLSLIDGLREKTILSVLCMTGFDLSRFKTSAEFVSWAGLAPDKKPHRKNKTCNPVGQVFREAAQSLHNSKGFLGIKYQTMKTKKKCSAKIIKAIARQLAIEFYTLFNCGEEHYIRKKIFWEKQAKPV